MGNSRRITKGNKSFIYKSGIVAAGNPADQPTVSAGDARELAVLVDVPAGETVEVRKMSVIRLLGAVTENSIANPTVISTTAHGLASGDSVDISGSNSTPTIDGTHVVTVIDENRFSVPVNVTVAGNTGVWDAGEFSFASTTSPAMTEPQELIVDHGGDGFKVEVVSKTGADPMNIYYRPL